MLPNPFLQNNLSTWTELACNLDERETSVNQWSIHLIIKLRFKLRNIPAIWALIDFIISQRANMGPMWMKRNFLIECIHACGIVSAWISEDEVSRLYTIVPFKKDCEIQSWWDASIALPPNTNCKCSSRINQMNKHE